VLKPLGLPLSEKQIPQAVKNIENRWNSKEALERAVMRPEQARGLEPDARTDLFSFGAVLFEMATGQQAFRADSAAVIYDAILNLNPPPPSQLNSAVPPQLDRIVQKALEKDRDLRYQSAGDLWAELKQLKREIDSAPPVPASAEVSQPEGSLPVQAAAPQRFAGARNMRWLMASIIVAVIAAAIFLFSRRPQDRVVEYTERALTAAFADPVVDAAIAPDGNSFVYATGKGLYLQLIPTGEVHQLPSPPDSRIFQVAWFPNNRDLLLVAMPSQSNWGALWTESVFGEPPHLLREDTREASVSSDGSQIAFVPNAQDSLWVMNADGRAAKTLARGEGGRVFSKLAWSPGRRQVFYLFYISSSSTPTSVERNGTNVLLQAFDLDSGKSRTFPLHPEQFCVLPNGNIFAMDTEYGFEEISTGSTVETLRHSSRGLTVAGGRPTVSADGKRILYLKGIAEGAVFVARLKDGGRRLEDTRRLISAGSESNAHDWTPDSQAVVFESNRENRRFHIFKQRLDGTAPERLVGGDVDAVAPRYGPDGKWLFYERGASHLTLMRMAASGGQPQVVLDHPNLANFYCTNRSANFCIVGEKEGNKLVFYRLDPNQDPPPGGFGSLPELARTDYDPTDWGVSPGGTMVAMVRPDEREGRIHLVSLSGAASKKASPAEDVMVKDWTNLFTINWAQAGRGWYVSNRPAALRGAPTFLYIDPAGAATTLYVPPTSAPIWGFPSPDGRYLAFCANPGIVSAWMIENF
jgi:Tol biopolymer transport system component